MGRTVAGQAVGAPAVRTAVSTECESRPTVDSAFRAYASYVAAIGRRLLGRDSELDDVVQDVFLASVRAIPRLGNPEAVKGLLATITVRIAARRLRRRRVRAFLGLDDAPDYAEVAAPGATPDQRLLLARLYAQLDRLPAAIRIAWTLRHLQGERLEDVARLCGCSLATAKRRISEGHLILEGALHHE